MKELSEPNHASIQRLEIGEQFKVNLAANPTAGYNWEISKLDPDFLSLVSENQTRFTSEKIGLGSLMTYVFEARTPGHTDLELIYRRSWDPNSGMNRFYIKVEIS